MMGRPAGPAGGNGGAPIMAGRPRFAPPPPVVERPAPRRGYVWAPGYHDWRDDRYVWVPGRYETERVGYEWQPPRWELQGGMFVSVPGGWISLNAEPTAPPPPPQPERVVGRPGFVWIAGYHEWRGDGYNWVPGRWEEARPRERWVPGRWVRHGKHWRWHHGGWRRR